MASLNSISLCFAEASLNLARASVLLGFNSTTFLKSATASVL
jgi:hypothetical protein